MIISHEHRYIFVKTRKTAGTSIEIALSEHCGPRDVITPISPADEEVRRRLGFRGPQNHLLTGLALWFAKLRREKAKKLRAFYNHNTAEEARSRLGVETWQRYFRFCVERNPWDKVVSAYWFRFPDGDREGLSRFILEGEAAGVSDFDRYTAEGELLVDYVVRFENLQGELDALLRKLGLPPVRLPRVKSGFRKDRRHYREVLTAEERDRIAREFSREIDLLGFQY